MKHTYSQALLALLMVGATQAADKVKVDCASNGALVQTEVRATPSSTLQIVEKSVRANPGCACEVVKAAIKASEAEIDLVASIVEVVAVAAPEQMRAAAQCAIAAAPDALAAVQAVLAKYDPAAGDGGTSGKEVTDKGGMPAKTDGPNPLDFPTNGETVVVGPSPGSNGGALYLPWYFPYQPPFVDTNPATNNNRVR